jgi:hypothetical protein
VSEDLDADLYADLYGDEEGSTEPKNERTEKPGATKPVAAPPVPATSTPAKEAKGEPSTATTDPRQHKPPSAAAPSQTTQAIPTSASVQSAISAPIQTIQTHTTPTPLLNSQPIAVAPLTSTAPSTGYNRQYQGGSPIPTGQQYEHRGVRPSEMKEEG